jgi:putative mRNA 3-end processing factor
MTPSLYERQTVIRTPAHPVGVEVSFQHANPNSGNESFLLRFDRGRGKTVCVLVDAGHGVDVDALLGPDDSLAAICLTHAHLDHYAELATAHRDNTPILTAPATASILTDVFDVASDEYDVRASDAMADAVQPIDDWTTIAPDIEIHPVPAGHVPGGVGFLVRAGDDDETHHLLATGDFTRRRAGGFPGLDPAAIADVDALFLTGATGDTFESSLTDALGTALERARSGSRTLVTTSGLFGSQCAYLLAALVDEYDLGIPLRVVGQVAKHYESLGYDHPAIETIPVFENPRECIGPGIITIAGPEIPHERSSGRLFDAIREDPGACVVQLVGSGEDPLTAGQCTIHDYECVNHPTRETLTAVHNVVEPTETVIVHKHGGAHGAFNDLNSAVWGAGDSTEYTLYDGRSWQSPPWMGGASLADGAGQSAQQFAEADLLESFTLPSLERYATPDLEAEGIDTEKIDAYLHRNTDATASLDVPDALTDQSPTTAASSNDDSNRMTSNSDSTDQNTAEPSSNVQTGLIDTSGLDLDDTIDPRMQKLLDDADLTPAEFMSAMRSSRKRKAEENQSATNESEGSEEHSEAVPESPTDEADDNADQTTSENQSEEGSEGAMPPQETSSAEDDVTRDTEETELSSRNSTSSLQVSVNPLVAAFAERAADNDSREAMTSVEAVTAAVTEYSLALLSGDAAGDETEAFNVDVAASSGIEQLLAESVADTDQFDAERALTTEGIAAVLTGDAQRTVEIRDADAVSRQLDAIVQNDSFAFENHQAVVEAAIVWYLTTD